MHTKPKSMCSCLMRRLYVSRQIECLSQAGCRKPFERKTKKPKWFQVKAIVCIDCRLCWAEVSWMHEREMINWNLWISLLFQLSISISGHSHFAFADGWRINIPFLQHSLVPFGILWFAFRKTEELFYQMNEERISVFLLFANVYDMDAEYKSQLSQHNERKKPWIVVCWY